jgi:hypothetical protein
MSTSQSFEALHRANPRAARGFDAAVGVAASSVRAAIAADHRVERRVSRRRSLPVAGAALAAAVAAAITLTVGSGGPAVEDAAAAVRTAAATSAASAERSGTAVVRITHGGQFWAGTTLRWNGDDLAVSSDAAGASTKSRGMRVVDGVLYGFDPGDGGWVELGDPRSIDPGSGTTPDEYLAAIRRDVGGTTLTEIAAGMGGASARRLEDGSTVYSATTRADVVAREAGFKEGRSIRVLPFGFVANGDAARADAPVQAAVTVGADGIVRRVALTWGGGAGSWTYTADYSDLGATPAPTAPADAKSLRELRTVGPRS